VLAIDLAACPPVSRTAMFCGNAVVGMELLAFSLCVMQDLIVFVFKTELYFLCI